MLALLAGLVLANQATVGQPAPDFELPAVDGTTVKLSDLAGKTVVLEWFNPGCPFVKYAHGDEGPLADQAARHGDDVVWLAINSGAPGKQGHGLDANKAATVLWKMNHPVLLDEPGEVGRLYGARTTPHMFVIDAEGKVVYGGAIDNAPMGRQSGAVVNYVDRALSEIAAGSTITNAETKPYGCSVKY